MNLSWSHALFQVHDINVMVDFYTNLLGFNVTDRGSMGKTEFAFLSQSASDHHQIGMTSGLPEDAATPPAVNHFAFRVGSLSDVKTWHTKLSEDERTSDVAPITHGNAWSLYFKDPEGNGIEIFCDTPWHVSQPHGGPWDPTASDDEIFETTLAKVKDDPQFMPIEAFYADQAKRLRT